MERDDFLNEVAPLKKRLRNLQNRASRSKSPKAVSETAAEFNNAVEQLSSLQQHLVAKNAELARTRQLLEEEKQRYQNLFHLAPDGYLVTDRRSLIVEANHAAAALLDVPRDSLIGKPLAFYVAKENLKNFLVQTARAAHRSGLDQFETRLRANHQKIVDVLVIVAASGNGGSLRWSIRDVTEKKQIEEKMRSSERLATMGSTALLLAQEISNPLNSMFTTVQRLRGDSESRADIRSAVTELVNETTRLRALLQKFLSFSLPASIHPYPADLCLLLDDILQAVTRLYSRPGLEIERIFPESLLIQVDHERIKQAFLNICMNALEAMPEGEKLTVAARIFERRVIVEFIDTGAGVPSGINIFDLFTTTKFQALGMGLPIARQIIHDHQGTISYSSQPRNTVFRVDLPAAQP